MAYYGKEELNFFETLLGLFFEPGVTVETLLQAEKPRFGLSILLCFLLSVFVPIFAQAYKYGVFIFDGNALLSLFLIMLFLFLSFVLVEGIFLNLVGVDFNLRHLWTLIAYCITPFLLALWLIYFFNYLSMGRLTLLTLLMTGLTQMDDKFMRIVPIAFMVAQLNLMLVFFYGVRFLGQMHSVTAAAVTMLSLIPFYISMLVALGIGEMIRPGTIEIFQQILISPINLTVYKL